ncbi:hypothetical protein M3661_16015 [Paenibacillus sp. MER 180]|uniref:hypothetical protein n=1 Tax=unclassified Paenibacillus TaxID=185978 RepID=UPI000806706D|nr:MULTISPECIES: hypothetical protein [unclassified Paenibacillus]MCM3291636.1 hypothetical protein [Paenibacillus sp. MER 180]OBY78440.1 hypothetical protein BBG47_16355 [Paenibacillus sp. KS1]
MKNLKIIGLTLFILMMTTTAVFAANSSVSVYVPGNAPFSDATDSIIGQNQYGKATINSSGAFSGFIHEYCNGKDTVYHYDMPNGGTKTITYYMSSGCSYKLFVKSDGVFPVVGNLQNYQ